MVATVRALAQHVNSRGEPKETAVSGRNWAALMLCIAAPSAASAEPMGRWFSGYGQGTTEYGIKNDSAGSDYLYIACSPEYGTSISFTIGGKNPRPRSTVIATIGSDEFELYTDGMGQFQTASRVSYDTFRTLWEAMRTGSAMRVRLSTGQSTAFTLKGAAKVLGRQHCQTDFER